MSLRRMIVSTLPAGLLTGVLALSMGSTARAAEPPARMGDNAALQYWQAIFFLPHLDAEQQKIVENAGGAPLDDATMKVVHSADTSFRYAVRGGKDRECNWGARYEQDGFFTLLPYVAQCRELARLDVLRGRLDVGAGHGEAAADDWLTNLALARHVGEGGPSISFLVQCAIESMTLESASQNLGRLDKPSLDRVARGLDALPPGASPATALHLERSSLHWVIAKMEATKDEDFRDAIDSMFVEEGKTDKTPGRDYGTRESFLKKLNAIDALYPKLEQAAGLPYDQFQKQWATLTDPMKGDFTAEFMGLASFPRVVQQGATTQARLAMFKAALAIAAGGPDAGKAHVDPFGSGPFEYRAAADGFELSSKLHDKDGKPVTLKVTMAK